MSVYDKTPIQRIKKDSNEDKTVLVHTIDILRPLPDELNDAYIVSKIGDRFDLLAKQFYSDTTKWDIIATHNPEAFNGSLFIPEGLTIRLPANVEGYIEYNRKFNDNR